MHRTQGFLKNMMIKFKICFLLVLVQLLMGCQQQVQQNIIPFEIIRQWTIGAGGNGMDILVSEQVTKDQALQLAEHLRAKYSRGFLMVNIFDSKEAYLHRDDANYPEKEYFKHFLIQIIRNPNTGANELTWAAEGRDH